MASSSTPEKKPKIRQVKDSCPSLTKMLKDLSKLKPTKTLKEMHSDVALMKSFLPNENEARQLQDIPPRIRRLPQQISIVCEKSLVMNMSQQHSEELSLPWSVILETYATASLLSKDNV